MLFLLDSFKCKVDFDLECKSNNVIYVARCYLWYLGNSIQFHFGQTCNRFHVRLNGHRACFKTDNLAFEKSALSMCNMIDHPSQFGDKFSYFNFGNIKQVASRNRDRAEDFFIFNCRSDFFCLYGYKFLKYRPHIISWRFGASFVRQMVLLSQELSPLHQVWLWYRSLVQKVDAGPPESNINDLPFKLDA